MQFKDYYGILGVARDASADDIKRAYRRLARKYHPDVSSEADAESRFKEMKEAYEVLKDPQKREAYDQFGKNWKAGQNFEPPPGWRGAAGHSERGFDAGHGGDFSDFFESLFGGQGPFGNEFGTARQRDLRMHGDDVNATIAISIEDAYRGATRQISLDVPEPDAAGGVRRRRRTLSVNIPKGITAGKRIRLEDQGQPGIGSGARSGDLYLKVEFEPHRLFRTDGKDVYLTLPVTPAEAVLGRTVQAPTPTGPVDLKVPPGSSSGKRLRLKGRGLPAKTPGDLFVELKIVAPADISAEARALYEQLDQLESHDPRAALKV